MLLTVWAAVVSERIRTGAKNSRKRHARRHLRPEAPVRVELTMADLQSAALASWLRRLFARILMPARELRQADGV